MFNPITPHSLKPFLYNRFKSGFLKGRQFIALSHNKPLVSKPTVNHSQLQTVFKRAIFTEIVVGSVSLGGGFVHLLDDNEIRGCILLGTGGVLILSGFMELDQTIKKIVEKPVEKNANPVDKPPTP